MTQIGKLLLSTTPPLYARGMPRPPQTCIAIDVWGVLQLVTGALQVVTSLQVVIVKFSPLPQPQDSYCFPVMPCY
jgi:hypothetical protein